LTPLWRSTSVAMFLRVAGRRQVGAALAVGERREADAPQLALEPRGADLRARLERLAPRLDDRAQRRAGDVDGGAAALVVRLDRGRRLVEREQDDER
jgi:hypothetical protein